MIWELKREAERDFDKFIKYVKKLEEDNKELRRCWSIEIETCNRYREKCDNLEKENKRISKQRDNLSWVCDRVMEENDYLEEENKKLKAELERYKKQYEHTMWEDE